MNENKPMKIKGRMGTTLKKVFTLSGGDTHKNKLELKKGKEIPSSVDSHIVLNAKQLMLCLKQV